MTRPSARHSLPLLAGVAVASLAASSARGLDYAYATPEPQQTGWPLTPEEEAYVLTPEHERRPGAEVTRHLPHLWPVVPAAGFWGGRSWLDTHAGLVQTVQADAGPIDVLLVGDSITQQWGSAWAHAFPKWKTVNIGIGGDKTQNVLWRLDHGGVAGLEPRAVVLLIGNNNMFFAPETGIEPAARGIKACADNLREKFPQAPLIVVKVFPAHAPGNRFYEDIRKVNAALDTLALDADPLVQVLDISGDLLDADGTLNKDLYQSDSIHLSPAGYARYAARLRPRLEKILGAGGGGPATKPAAPVGPKAASSQKNPEYPHAAYAAGRMDPQPFGWPLTVAELAYVQTPEYDRKPGHEEQRHLPALWPVVPTAARWGEEPMSNVWIDHHRRTIDEVQAAGSKLDILLIGDSITQGWGGSPIDRMAVNAAWKAAFGSQRMVNAGIGGDRTESVLWRLEHGLVDGASPKVVVLMIGVNNAPLVAANGVPAEAVAQGVGLCVDALRRKCPTTQVVVVKTLPAFAPGSDVRACVDTINVAIDRRDLARDPQVHVVDASAAFRTADGGRADGLTTADDLHLTPRGYAVLAGQLAPVIERLLGR